MKAYNIDDAKTRLELSAYVEGWLRGATTARPFTLSEASNYIHALTNLVFSDDDLEEVLIAFHCSPPDAGKEWRWPENIEAALNEIDDEKARYQKLCNRLTVEARGRLAHQWNLLP